MLQENNVMHHPPGYFVQGRLVHKEMVLFVQMFLTKLKNPLIAGYWLFNCLAILSCLLIIRFEPVPFIDGLLSAISGLSLFFLLLPVHESLHGLAYKICGAPNVSFHKVPKRLLFYALADRFIIGSKKFLFVAFTPFIVISLLMSIAMFNAVGAWTWFWWTAIIVHTSGCGGDFALAAYFWENRKAKPMTYDLKKEGVTVFLQKSSNLEINNKSS